MLSATQGHNKPTCHNHAPIESLKMIVNYQMTTNNNSSEWCERWNKSTGFKLFPYSRQCKGDCRFQLTEVVTSYHGI